MPKIRGVKPDFWTDKNIVILSPLARLLYIGMWNYAADCGHLEDEPIELKMRILPADNCDVGELLNELEKGGRITREGGVICIPKLAGHQRIDKRYYTACPACKEPGSAPSPHGGHDAPGPPRDGRPAGPTTGTHRGHVVSTSGPLVDCDCDGDGDGDGDMPPKPARGDRATKLPAGFKPNQANIALAATEGVDLRREYAKFTDHHLAKGSKFVDWQRALATWIRNVNDYRGATVRQLPRTDPDAPPMIPLASDDKR